MIELKRTEPLASTLSGLLRQTIRDVRRIEKTPGYGLAMEIWHNFFTRDNTCYVCMAGAVMACTLGVPKTAAGGAVFDSVGAADKTKLYAINEMRVGRFEEAIRLLTGTRERTDKEITALIDANHAVDAEWNSNKDHSSWDAYEKAAGILEEAGL